MVYTLMAVYTPHTPTITLLFHHGRKETDMRLTKEEQETIIIFDASSAMAEVYTHDRPLKRKMSEALKRRPDIVEYKGANGVGGETYMIPKKYISVRVPRILTDTQRQKCVNRLRENRSKE